MSYDLYFYKQKGSDISTENISSYLSNIIKGNEENNQWFFENEDTEVYFSFDYNAVDEDIEDNKEKEFIENFDDTNFTFNLNFMRPCFFGREAFQFVEQFCNDLNLYVFNPQGDTSQPYKPNRQEQFDTWNKTNILVSKTHFNEEQTCYLSEDDCNKVWEYNYNRKYLQHKLGDGYFVPKIFFFRTKQTNQPFTLTTWTDHIPIVLPVTDYILLLRKYKKLFRTVTDMALVSRENLLHVFGDHFENFDFPDCKIIHQNKADHVKDQFNSIKSEYELNQYAERLGIEFLYNARP